ARGGAQRADPGHDLRRVPDVGVLGFAHDHHRIHRRRAEAGARGAPRVPRRLRSRGDRRHPPDQGPPREAARGGRVLDGVIARILIWNLFASKTTLDELREPFPSLPEGATWISNEAQDRFGLISFGDRLPALGEVPELIGDEPAVAEEFDVE